MAGDEIYTWKGNDYAMSWLVDINVRNVQDSAWDGLWYDKLSSQPSTDTVSWGEGFWWLTKTEMETLWLTGLVPSTDLFVTVPERPGQILMGQPFPVSDGMPLNADSVENLGIVASGGQAGNDPVLADSLFLFPCGGGFDVKYLEVDGLWHDDGEPAPSEARLFPGQGFWVRRGSEGTGEAFVWSVPKPY